MVDVAVQSGAAWVCRGRGVLADVLLPVDLRPDHEEELVQSDGGQTDSGGPVLLQQTEEGSPCVLTLRCTSSSSSSCSSSCSSSAIGRLLVVSEARTMEVYDQTGEYCGTIRGERHDGVQTDSADRGPFYRKQLILEQPASACEVKLLSLGGRSSVMVSRVVVGLRAPGPPPVAPGPGIDMQQVQSLVEEMGTSLSPGAQHLMEMVQFQQKNQTASLGGFLPLLMGGGGGGGGVFSALALGVSPSPQSADSRPPVASVRSADEAPPTQNGVTSNGSPDTKDTTHVAPASPAPPASPAHLAKMMSQLLSPGPELLPLLQGLCGHVTKLRLDDANARAEREKLLTNGSWELDAAMEQRLEEIERRLDVEQRLEEMERRLDVEQRLEEIERRLDVEQRLEEMERRLKEHVDRRLDALEQKLEQVLLSALPNGKVSADSGSSTAEKPQPITD